MGLLVREHVAEGRAAHEAGWRERGLIMLRALHDYLDRYEPADLTRAALFISIIALFVSVLALFS
jgi:hypothetical protein